MNHALLQQALDALEQCTYDEEGYLLNPDNEEVIEALKAELEEPEQEPEPYAWVFVPHNELLWPDEVEHKTPCKATGYIPLYAAPTEPNCKFPTCHSQEYQDKLVNEILGQEPVAWRFVDDRDNNHPTYRSTPPTPEQAAYLAKWERPSWEPLYTKGTP